MLSSIFPDEIAEEILSRVPAKSLTRWKLVSKSWSELITAEPQFMVRHRKYRASITNNGCVLLKEWWSTTNQIYTMLTRESHQQQQVTSAVDIDTVPPFLEIERSRNVNVVAACDGILCAHYGNGDVLLSNPSIREYKELPKCSPVQAKLPKSAFIYAPILGLGFDRKSNDYKVVRILSFQLDMEPGKIRYGPVEVCTLNSNSPWKEIDVVPNSIISSSRDNVLCIKGRCYWRSSFALPEALVRFDMADEVFQEIELPQVRSTVRASWKYMAWAGMAELKESIALISPPLKNNVKCFEVWLMKETDVDDVATITNKSQFSWSKYVTIKTNRVMLFPVVFLRNGELLLQGGQCGKLLFHNPRTGETGIGS